MKHLVTLAVSTGMAASLFFPNAVLAHNPAAGNIPICACWIEGREVVCEGRRVGRGNMAGSRFEVFGYDHVKLLSTRLDSKARVRFPRPEHPFYILMEDPRFNSETVEVDWRDVDATKPKER